MDKYVWRDTNARLDAETDCVQIMATLAMHEFPWDINQALSLALFRTYAVPSIGRLLDETSEFGDRVQKRYDDTGLLLEAPLLHGFDSAEGRSAVRRINQMHRRYDISNDDMRYVLSTFVVVPRRWLDAYGWRPLTEHEVAASVHYYRKLGERMAIRDLPETYAGFARLMDDYEAEHFAFDAGGRRVADSTLGLMTTFYPRPAAPAVRLFSRALMDPPLLEAFDYPEPGRAARVVSEGALRLRAKVVARMPVRRRPRHAVDSPRIRSYPGGFDYAQMGTFAPGTAPGCPVAHTATDRAETTRASEPA